MIQDLRYALRMMRGQPLFTAMAVLSLALGIGANTAIYSFMEAILMRSLPVSDPASLVVLNWRSKASPAVVRNLSGSSYRDPKTGYTSGNFPYAAFELARENRSVFSSVFAFSNAGRLNVQINGTADLASGQFVSGEFFQTLGAAPAAGRVMGPADDREGAPPVAVISYGYARKRFGDATKATGASILVNDTPFTVAGVAPPEFFGVNPAGQQDLYLPMQARMILATANAAEQRRILGDRNYYWVEMMARLRPGVGREQAQAALAPEFARFVASTANDKERADLPALLLKDGGGGIDGLRRQYSKPLYILIALAGLILAIACANMANLLLARAAGRRREMALRLGLGASRMRVMRQLLTEAVLLASLGGLAGTLMAAWGIEGLTLLIGNGRENFTLHAQLNWNVLAVTFGLAMVTGAFFGLAPALQSTRLDLVPALKQTRAGEHRAPLHSRLGVSLSQGLAAIQIAMSLLLLIAAGLFVRTLTNLNVIELGFNRENLLLVTINPRQAGYRDAALTRFYQDLHTRFRSVPGVRSVSLSNYALVSGSRSSMGIQIPGNPSERNVSVLDIGPDFFSAMQIPILLGRELDDRDVSGRRPVAVVNETFVRSYLGVGNPIGRQFRFGSAADHFEVVGIAKTARLSSLKEEIPPVAYVPYNQGRRQASQMTYVLRAAGDPLGLAAGARQVVREADARIPISNIVTQAMQIDQTIGQERTFAILCSCFAGLALVIACVGLYGMMAYRVARRTSEIGIRMALGAERRRIMWMVIREALAISAAGVAIGVPAALAISPQLKDFLFQMRPDDAVTVSIAAAAMLAAAVSAGYGPAWRASRVDPWTALRDE